ncbi:hypothetical protein HIM_09395 [Hirsutella minnesotensis 3608]|uniref:MULE transposase domain-containing protein n=1 Tax=Hirsutella minnesotensis 3608 TaxID=1043627 RepID=A0A0F8A345_9HYPO|nr:hypothetical protein HIM_10166 [Hirsutella minnesotensis 3608]KJZ71189.1 hypothetical protein HIM_09395 [Hirsutella minnesotensis 3608]
MDFMSTVFATNYGSEEEAIQACRAIGWEVGFSLRRQNTWPPKSSGKPATYLLLECGKGGKYKDQHSSTVHGSKSRLNTSSQKTGCKFKLCLKKQEPASHWRVMPASTAEPHNHPFSNPITHSSFRAGLLKDRAGQIRQLYNGGLRPYQIADYLRRLGDQEDHNLRGLQGIHIANFLAQLRRDELAGRAPIQFLYDLLKDSSIGFFWRDTRDIEGRLTGLFIAPASSVSLWRQYWHSLLLDCTYKTNRFKMPLLNFCGSTSERMTFSIAAAFLTGEAELQYRWALSCLIELATEEGIPLPRVIVTDRELALMNALTLTALATVLHLLCRWHISKNVLAKTKAFFPKATKGGNVITRAPEFTAFLDAWASLVQAPEEDVFYKRLQAFKTAGYPPAAVAYAVDTWLDPWKDKFVACFVNRHRHFGHTTTSIIEGMHSTMKKFLWSSTGDLNSVFQRLQTFWSYQAAEIASKHQAAGHKVATSTLQPIFAKIRPNLSRWALLRIGVEFRAVPAPNTLDEKTKPPAGRCNRQHHCSFKATLGLPCRHDIFNRVKASSRGFGSVIPFEMNEVDEFWHQQRPRPRPDDAPLEPLPIRGKGRPKGSLNLERSTRREASEFEVIESIERAEAVPLPPPSTAPAALPGGTRKSTRKRKADGKADGRGRPAAAKTTANSTARGLDHLHRHGDTYEPGTEAPRQWQREEEDYDELAGETQGSIHVQLSQSYWRAIEAELDEDAELQEELDELAKGS